MSKYVEADALAYLVVINGDADFINKVTKLMIDAPSIDIVRCKECKHRGFYLEDADMYICNACDQLAFDPMHFCSYGERRDDE